MSYIGLGQIPVSWQPGPLPWPREPISQGRGGPRQRSLCPSWEYVNCYRGGFNADAISSEARSPSSVETPPAAPLGTAKETVEAGNHPVADAEDSGLAISGRKVRAALIGALLAVVLNCIRPSESPHVARPVRRGDNCSLGSYPGSARPRLATIEERLEVRADCQNVPGASCPRQRCGAVAVASRAAARPRLPGLEGMLVAIVDRRAVGTAITTRQ